MTFTYDKGKARRGAAPQKSARQSHENHFLNLNFCDNQINNHGDDSSCEGSWELIQQSDEHKQEYTQPVSASLVLSGAAHPSSDL
jgi:hypothetical protein